VLEEFPGRDLIEKAEDLVMSLRDIQSCRIATDQSGKISEIHVVAATDRSPKMIARDVETCLKAQLGLAVDYRKIGVVIIDAMRTEDLPDPPGRGDRQLDELVEEKLSENGPGLEFLEDEVRVRFKGLDISIDETRVDVEVRLEKNGIEAAGSQAQLRKSGPIYETIAGAALHALDELLDEDFQLTLSGIEEVELPGRKAIVVAIDQIDGRMVKSYAGSAFIGRDPNEATVLAVLDAINRPLGRWKSRREIHYRIS
jgi:hypothetical protein